MDLIRLTEATINLRDGQLLGDMLRSLAMLAVEAVSELLPPAKANKQGSLPYQYVSMSDVTADTAVILASRYGYDTTDDQRFSKAYRVPWTSADGEVTIGTPEQVVARLVYEPAPAAETSTQESVDVGALRRRILRAFVDPSRRAAVERAADAALKDTRVTESMKASVRLDLEDLRAGRRGPAVERHRSAGLLGS